MRAALSVSVFVTLVAISGCTSSENPKPDPKLPSFVGSHLSDLRPAIGSRTFLIYDVSEPVLGLAPLYNDGQPQDKWTVVAQCTSKGTLAVAVLPSDGVTEEIASDAASGDYESTLTECS